MTNDAVLGKDKNTNSQTIAQVLSKPLANHKQLFLQTNYGMERSPQ